MSVLGSKNPPRRASGHAPICDVIAEWSSATVAVQTEICLNDRLVTLIDPRSLIPPLEPRELVRFAVLREIS